MMVMPVLMDKDNNVIRPIIHWFDNRLQKQYFKLKKEGKDKVISFLFRKRNYRRKRSQFTGLGKRE